jgi:uncharacterized protein
MIKTTLVLGASSNPDRVAYLAVKSLKKRGIPVISIGNRPYEDSEMKILTGKPTDIPHVHTVTLYLGPPNQTEYYDYIISLHPERIIFNPGTANQELSKIASDNGIEVVEGCMLVMLKTGQF